METRIPLAKRIRKESHRQIALAQDIVLEEVYRHLPKAVLHGGTAIWRCYGGKRFSEDLDFYLRKDLKAIEELFASLQTKGFEVKKKKIADRSMYSELAFNRTSVRLEATFQPIEGTLTDYEKADGTIITIYSLTPEQLVKEKAHTYLKRGKIRDLWDVFFLLKLVRDFKQVKHELKILIDGFEPPPDETDLKAIILEGIVPSSKEMLEYIRRKWENPNI